ncbi:hypothetical protein EC968_008082 [Mortierella alpina]|nr:hypothetical protein EC968_008082 [Mortierella alpina]
MGMFQQRADLARLSAALLTLPAVDELNIDTKDNIAEDEDLAEIISSRRPATVEPATVEPAPTLATSAWKSIEIRAPKFGPLASAAIASHAPTLERVVLRDRGLEVPHIEGPLATATNLKTLVSLSKERHSHTFLNPSRVGHTPWICANSLEELQLSLRTGKCTWAARETLMNRLGELEELKVLHFQNGITKRSGFSDFSLKKGELRRLSGLKNLEVFEL